MQQLVGIIDKAPTENKSYIQVYSLGGAIRDLDVNRTAFPSRKANYIMAITSDWETKEEAPIHKKWVEAGFAYIYAITRGHI